MDGRPAGIQSRTLRVSNPIPAKRQDATCPFNADHTGAAPYSADYPYTGARDGLPGAGIGGIPVPAPGDEAHYFTAPGPNDIRGPCPGMNTAANHNFLSHDGITTLTELLDAQMNLFNLDLPLATIIAVRALALVGDITTLKMSIGCDATSRTALPGNVLASESGLNGHNKFEADTSLTRLDYFLGDGDNFSFQGDMFARMSAIANGSFDRTAIAQYRSERYDDSLNTNPNFYFGPKSILLYGAASFVYEVMPVFGPEGKPDDPTIQSFFGAVPNGDGGFDHVPERIPDNWSNRRTAYGVLEIVEEIRYQYQYAPKLFGGNAGIGHFDVLPDFEAIQDGKLAENLTAHDIECLLYQVATENLPGTVEVPLQLPFDILDFLTTNINPVFENSGCPLNI